MYVANYAEVILLVMPENFSFSCADFAFTLFFFCKFVRQIETTVTLQFYLRLILNNASS